MTRDDYTALEIHTLLCWSVSEYQWICGRSVTSSGSRIQKWDGAGENRHLTNIDLAKVRSIRAIVPSGSDDRNTIMREIDMNDERGDSCRITVVMKRTACPTSTSYAIDV